jgi:hypothetical protein
MPMLATCSVCGRVSESSRCPDHPRRSSAAQQRFRVAVLLRDGHRCRRCGSNADVVAAHWPIPLRSFGADPAAYDPRHGITLCRDCHRRMDPHAY